MADDVQLTMANTEEQFVRRLFQGYYERIDAERLAPKEIAKREFGVGTWTKKIETRHLAFKGPQELKSYLTRNPAFYISYSAAYYEFPDGRPMQRKNWQGADLIFDLDADHLRLECVEKGEHAKGWVCGKCISVVKDETMRLIEEFLVPDFGFSKSEISVNFSGNRGFHVHIAGETVRQMSGWARREVVDYISGTGLNDDRIFHMDSPDRTGPAPDSPGWGGKMARRLIQLLETGKFLDIGLEPKLARRLLKKKEEMTAGVRRGKWGAVKMTGAEYDQLCWRLRESASVPLEGIEGAGGEVDAGVTFDVSRLIRLPESLHGETGLAAKKLGRADDLPSFDPMRDAVVFGSRPVRVKCREVPKFEMGGGEFGPFSDEDAELPEFAAIYLICKRKATLWK